MTDNTTPPLPEAVKGVSTAEPEGWKLVPIEPTPGMLYAMWQRRDAMRGQSENKIARESYDLMLYAAPSHPPATPEKCLTCNGHGLIGGLLPGDGGYDSLPCPDCNAPEPAVAVQAEPAWCDACSQMVGDQCPSGMCEMKKGVEPERQDPLSRTRDEHSPGLAEPIVRWKNLDAAMKDPLFQSLRGVMGTANYGQDDALFRVLSHFEAAHPKPAAPATADEAASEAEISATINAMDRVPYGIGSRRVDAVAFARAILALRSGASAQPAEGGAT